MALIPRDRIAALLPRAPQDRRIPYASLSGVLYAGPNPDGSRKMCRNCYKFVVAGRCLEVTGPIDPTQVCGSHVFGKPQATDLLGYTLAGDGGTPIKKMSQVEAGLVATPGDAGTSCDNCRFFSPGSTGAPRPTKRDEFGQAQQYGLCEAVAGADGTPPVAVEPMGCCARWEYAPWVL